MDRRNFFKRATSKVTRVAVEKADALAQDNASRWIRPPYALDELEFLLACTRCGDCVDACEYKTIFLLPARVGAKSVGTPALDLLNKGCHLCADWPCVAACEPKALKLPDVKEPESIQLPCLAMAEIDVSACLPYSGPECGACVNSCPVPDALQWELEKPVINEKLCVGCGMCREACIVEPKAVLIRSSIRG